MVAVNRVSVEASSVARAEHLLLTASSDRSIRCQRAPPDLLESPTLPLSLSLTHTLVGVCRAEHLLLTASSDRSIRSASKRRGNNLE